MRLPDGRILRGATDASGKFHVEFPTEGFAQEMLLTLVAQLPQDGVAATANVSLAIRAFEVAIKTNRDVYLDGESFLATVTTRDALGKPTGEKLSATLIKVVTQNNRTTEREVTRKLPRENNVKSSGCRSTGIYAPRAAWIGVYDFCGNPSSPQTRQLAFSVRRWPMRVQEDAPGMSLVEPEATSHPARTAK